MFNRSKKFWSLVRERDTRELSASETNFLDQYLGDNPQEAEEWQAEQMALNLLRGQVIEGEPSENFESTILRKHHVATVKRSLSYWSPALVGGSIAALAALAILQVVVQTRAVRPTFKPGTSEARNVTAPLSFPDSSSIDR